MADPIVKRQLLQEQLSSIEQEIQNKVYERAAMEWGLGPIRRASTTSGLIVTLFLGFHLACLASGIAMITIGGLFQTIGIAVTVGAIFGFGSFMAQWWAVVVQRELSVKDAAFKESDAVVWHELTVKRNDILKQLAILDDSSRDEGRRP